MVVESKVGRSREQAGLRGSIVLHPIGENAAGWLGQRHGHGGAASRCVCGLRKITRAMGQQRGSRCLCWDEGIEGGGAESTESRGRQGSKDAAPSWCLPLAEPSRGVLSGGVQGWGRRGG